MTDPAYSFSERLLHRLALHYESIAEASFDMDQSMVRTDPALIVARRHVFVAGLARAGTTLLMRRFHATGQYRSLTYRDMPFVLAPNLWRKLSLSSRRDIEGAERAHGDRMLVDADSPESFDEVFWRIFAGDDYLESSRLKPHTPANAVVNKYVRYVNAVLHAQEPRLDRYLSKNNNNVLRLGAIHHAFPNALVLIPFREPLQHANSLLRQHVRFSELQARRKFTLSYMTWLGHHEFGLDHRPFRFDGEPLRQYASNTLDYWLQLWTETYSWLERFKPQSALFVGYEDLCTRAETWARLAEKAGIPVVQERGDVFSLSAKTLESPFDRALSEHASAIYGRLNTQSHSQLS